MFKIEKNFLDWIEKNLTVIVFVLGNIVSLLIRYVFKDIVSGDYTRFLEGWYNQIYEGGGIASLREQVGNYNFLYQICIAIMTYFPIKPLYAYKILSILFDYLLAIAVAVVVGIVSSDNKKNNALIAYFVVLFSPIVILNSSAWAQCDSIYVFWVIIAVIFLFKEKYFLTFIFLGMSFSFKLQAVFILPFFLLIYFVNKKFSIFNFVIIPLTMLITGLPVLLFGRSVFDIFLIYSDQTNRYTKVAMNYPSFWSILFNVNSTDYYNSQKFAAVFLTIVVLAVIMIWWIANNVELNNQNMIYLAFTLSYTCVLFLPQMHERYGYLYEILAIILVMINRKTIKLIIPLYIITLITYGNFLFGLGYGIDIYIGIANIFVWFSYMNLISKEVIKSSEK